MIEICDFSYEIPVPTGVKKVKSKAVPINKNMFLFVFIVIYNPETGSTSFPSCFEKINIFP